MGWEADYLAEARAAIVGATSQQELEHARVAYLGRRSRLTEALRSAKDLSVGERAELNRTKAALEEAFAAAREEIRGRALDRALRDEVVDATLPGEDLPVGHLHPTTHIRRIVEDAFLGLGYQIYDDREVEWVEDNFDKLAFPEWHPARSPRDTFFLDERRLLRTETSPSQIHVMQEQAPPIYMVSIGRVYRRDEITPTRFPIFHQFEGLAVDRGLTLADLKGTLLHVMRALFGQERGVRFRTHYFPFTEPSIEPDVSCPVCGGVGCRTCKFTGWIEFGGAGMVDPAVFENVALDPEEWSGFAFGCGLERGAQLLYGIPEIRPFWESDVRVLAQF